MSFKKNENTKNRNIKYKGVLIAIETKSGKDIRGYLRVIKDKLQLYIDKNYNYYNETEDVEYETSFKDMVKVKQLENTQSVKIEKDTKTVKRAKTRRSVPIPRSLKYV